MSPLNILDSVLFLICPDGAWNLSWLNRLFYTSGHWAYFIYGYVTQVNPGTYAKTIGKEPFVLIRVS